MAYLALVLLGTAVVVLFALLVAVGAAKLARMDGATYAAATMRAAAVFAAVLTLAATLTVAVVQLLI